MCLTPSFRLSLGKKEALNWANVSLTPLPNSCIGHPVTQNVLALFWTVFLFHFQYSFFQYPLLEEKSKTKQNKKTHQLFSGWAEKTLTRHLSCSYSPMFDLIAFPPLCATALSSLALTDSAGSQRGRYCYFDSQARRQG